MDAPSHGELGFADLAAELRASGLRVTQPRLVIYQHLFENGGHHTAESIATMVSEAGEHFSRATIFNVLHDLTSHGLLGTIQAGQGPRQYEALSHRHDHLVCRQCHAIFDLPESGQPGAVAPSKLHEMGFVVERAEIVYRGLCRACLAQAPPAV